MRNMIRGLQLFENAVNQIASSLADAFGLEQELEQAERDRDEAEEEQRHVNTQREDSRPRPRHPAFTSPARPEPTITTFPSRSSSMAYRCHSSGSATTSSNAYSSGSTG